MNAWISRIAGLLALPLSAAALADPPASPSSPPSTQPGADAETVNELRDLVRDLRGEVDALKAQNDDNWLTQQRAEEIRGLVHDVLADADTRASLLQSGLMAGYDKGFFLASADGNFMLKIEGQMAVRFVYNSIDEASADDSDRWGFENRRMKLGFKGYVVDPSWEYEIVAAFDRGDGTFSGVPSGSGGGGDLRLEVAAIKKNLGNGWSVRFGQFKGPFLHEELVSSKRQLAVERSLVNEEFNQDYMQGVELGYSADAWRAFAMYSDGFGTRNTPVFTEDTEYAFTGRAEFLISGTDWKQFDDFTSWRGEEFAALAGVAGHIQKGEFGTATAEVEVTTLTADLSLEFGGVNGYAAVVYRGLEDDVTGLDADQFGFIVQGGFFLTADWEAFARYEFGDFDTLGVEDLSVVTVGVNRYWAKHALKWTTDVGFGLDEVASAWSTSGAGWRTDPVGEDGQFVVRSQFQLLF